MEEDGEVLLEDDNSVDAPAEEQEIAGIQQEAAKLVVPETPQETAAEKGLRLALVEERKRNQEMMAFLRENRPQRETEAPKPTPSIFEDEERAINLRVEGHITPLQAQMIALARDNAELRYTPEAVQEAEAAYEEARTNGTLAMSDYQAIMQSPNRYKAAVEWHQRNKVLTETGGSLDGYQNKLLSDPAFLEKAAQAYAKLKSGQPAPQPSPVFRVPQAKAPAAPSPAMSDSEYLALLRR